MRNAIALASVLLLFAAGCGYDYLSPLIPTNSPPVVFRVAPNSGSAGDEITIFGLGFSIAYPENIIVIGGAPTGATSYGLVDDPDPGEIEAITFIVPAEALEGEGAIYVQVQGRSSNTDVSFTVLP